MAEDSKQRHTTTSAIARTHEITARRRDDWIEKTTTTLVGDYELLAIEELAVEDLAVRNMTAKRKPKEDREHPGRFLPNGARAKAGLERVILVKGWSTFLTRLEQKAGASGVTVVGVNPASTSQTCRACGHLAQESREHRAVFSCVACGYEDHEDHAFHGHHCRAGHPGPGLCVLAPIPGQGESRHRPAARISPSHDGNGNLREGVAP